MRTLFEPIKWALILTLATALHIYAQSQALLQSEGVSKIYLVNDSTDYDTPDADVEFVTSRVTGSYSRNTHHQMDCSTLKIRSQYRDTWGPWLTLNNTLHIAQYKQVCQFFSADRWTFMTSNGGDEYFADRATINTVPRQAQGKRIWIKTVYDTPKENLFGSRIVSEMNRYDFDCVERKLRTIASVEYDSIGNSRGVTESDPKTLKWTSIIPESIGESLRQWVCVTLPFVDKNWPVKAR